MLHDTHSNIWDFPCKSQSCASLEKFCANVVPEHKRTYLDFWTEILYNKPRCQETKNVISAKRQITISRKSQHSPSGGSLLDLINGMAVPSYRKGISYENCDKDTVNTGFVFP